MKTTIITDAAHAIFLAETLAPNSQRPPVWEALTDDHGTLTLTKAHLARLAQLDSEDDGHFDGKYIWMGGSEWPVLSDDLIAQLRDVPRIDEEAATAKEAIDRAIELIPSDLVLAKLTGRDRTGIWRRRAVLTKTA